MKRYIISLIIGCLLLFFGIMLTITEVMNFNVVDEITYNDLNSKTIIFDQKIVGNDVQITTNFTKVPSVSYNNSLTPGNYVIEVTYYEDLMNINHTSNTYNNTNYVDINADPQDNFTAVKKFINLTFDGLINKKVYNYNEALRPKVNIIINEADKDKIQIEG